MSITLTEQMQIVINNADVVTEVIPVVAAELIWLSNEWQFSMHSQTGQCSPSHSWPDSMMMNIPASIMTVSIAVAVTAAKVFINVEFEPDSTC